MISQELTTKDVKLVGYEKSYLLVALPGGDYNPPPPPIGLPTKMQNKKNTTFLPFWDCLLHWDDSKMI